MASTPLESLDFSEFIAPQEIDTSTLGRIVRGLSFEEVQEILEDKGIYEGRVPSQYVYLGQCSADRGFLGKFITSARHPFSPYVQTECIIHSNTTPQEKAALWNLYFYRNFADVKFTVVTHYYNHIETGKSLKTAVHKLDDIAPRYSGNTSLLQRLLPYTFSCSLGATCGALAGLVSFALYDAVINKNTALLDENIKTVKLWSLIGAALGACAGYKITAKKRAAKAASEYALNLLKVHAAQIAEVQKFIPAYFIKNLQGLYDQLWNISYQDGEDYDEEKFKEWFNVLFDYYKNFELKSDPDSGEPDLLFTSEKGDPS